MMMMMIIIIIIGHLKRDKITQVRDKLWDIYYFHIFLVSPTTLIPHD